jgi:hypothetical protein
MPGASYDVRCQLQLLEGVLTTARWGITSSVEHLFTDYIHPTPMGGHCRVRVYLPEEEDDAPVVLCSELPSSTGLSVTSAVKLIAGRSSPSSPTSRADPPYG